MYSGSPRIVAVEDVGSSPARKTLCRNAASGDAGCRSRWAHFPRRTSTPIASRPPRNPEKLEFNRHAGWSSPRCAPGVSRNSSPTVRNSDSLRMVRRCSRGWEACWCALASRRYCTLQHGPDLVAAARRRARRGAGSRPRRRRRTRRTGSAMSCHLAGPPSSRRRAARCGHRAPRGS